MLLWTRYILSRLLQSLFVVVALIIISFAMVRLIPGDPAERMAPQEATDEYIADLRHDLGLSGPLSEQFSTYMGNILTGNFGTSFITGEPVINIIVQRIPYTLSLSLISLFVLLLIGFAVGVIVAIATRGGRRSVLERGYILISAMLGAVPELVIAILLTVVFAVSLGWFPISGAGSIAAIVLPTLSIAIRGGINLSRFVKVEADSVLRSDYVRTVRSKRLPAMLIYRRHVLPNVATPALVVAGLIFPSIVGGAVIVENVFSWPGLGMTVVRAVASADYPVIQGCIIFFGVVVAISNLTVDVIVSILDPRSSVAK